MALWQLRDEDERQAEMDRREEEEEKVEVDDETALLEGKLKATTSFDRNMGYFYKLNEHGYPLIVKVGVGGVGDIMGIKPFWLLKKIDGIDARCTSEENYEIKMQRQVDMLMLENV